MTIIDLNDPDVNKLPLHDAKFVTLKTIWANDGEMSLCLSCELNAEELPRLRAELGINSSVLNLEFKGVWRLQLDGIGDSSSQEVISTWQIVQPSPLIDAIKKQRSNNGSSLKLHLFHHRIEGSAGSKIEIVFEELHLNEVK